MASKFLLILSILFAISIAMVCVVEAKEIHISECYTDAKQIPPCPRGKTWVVDKVAFCEEDARNPAISVFNKRVQRICETR